MRKLWIVLLAAGAVAGGPWALTQARFVDRAGTGSTVFTTGPVDVSSSPASAFLSVGAMAPGDVVTAPISVSNAGTTRLRYAMSTDSRGEATLADGLTLAVKSGVTACSDVGFREAGTLVYSGSLRAGVIRDRTLDSSASEVLCFQVTLPATAPDALQNVGAIPTFTFGAEQA